MSEKTAKPRKGKAAAGKDDAGVLGSLPATRSTRFASDRAQRSRGGASATNPKAATKAKPKTATTTRPKSSAAAKPKAAAQSKAVAQPKAAAQSKTAAGAKPKAGAQSKAAAGAKPRSAARSKAAATAKPKTAAQKKPAKVTTVRPAPGTPATPAAEPAVAHRPRPVRAGAPALAESTERARSEPAEPLEPGAAPPSGTELVTTAIQAAGELAQIGLKMSGHALKRAVDKLPKP